LERDMTMEQHSYRTTFLVEATPQETFAAVNDVRGWWSEDLDGRTDTVGAEFAFRGNHQGVNVHRARIKVTDLVPGERVAWQVLDNHFTFTEDQSEWTGTRIVFELVPVDAGTEVRFSHLGLLPAHECYDVCSNAWAGFLHDSLPHLAETGRGEPMQRLDRTPAQSA
jgi:Activator of Hsp90 ATPase homolog 1-like protein